jgi:glycosyltransferase involved in cell wall biosynthesis
MTTVAGRIALVTDEPAGKETTEIDDLAGLLDRGWDVRLVTPRWDPGLPPPEPERAARTRSCWRRGPRLGAGLALARAAVHNPTGAGRVASDPGVRTGVWCRRQLAGHLIALRPSLVHFGTGREAANWLGVTDSLGCTMVVGVTADDLYGLGSEPFEGCKEVWARASGVHFPDRALEHRALQRGCPADLPRAVIPPPVDTTYFAPSAETDGRSPSGETLRIVSAGALGWMQGLEHAIHATRLLRDMGVDSEYTIIGDGEHLPALTFARHQLGVRDHVHFSGRVPPDELRAHLRSADVFLSASVVDGLPGTVLQAMASGTPVVMSDPGAIGDVGLDGQAALTVPRRNPKGLAEKLAALAGDERLRRDMAGAARRWAVQQAFPAERLAALNGLFRRSLDFSGSAQRRAPGPASPAGRDRAQRAQ